MVASFARSLGIGAVVTAALLAAGLTFAQEPADPPAEAPPPVAEKKADEPPVLREQTIYVPYTKLKSLFEKQGRGVFLPYEKFEELWKAAQAQKAAPGAEQAPVGALVSAIDSEATVDKDVVRVVAKIHVELLTPGWHSVPLNLADAAVRSATIAGQPARLIVDASGTTQLLIKHEGDQPAEFDLLLEYAKAFEKSPGQNSVSFAAPQAPVNRWKVTIPQPGIKVSIHPLVAATEPAEPAPAPQPPQPPAAAKETRLEAFVGPAPTVRIEWTPKSEGAAGLAALYTVQAEQEVSIEERVVRTRARLVYEVSRAEISQLQIELPADQKVLNVFDANVRGWGVKANEGMLTQTVTVDLFQPARDTQTLQLDLERTENKDQVEVAVPAIRAIGAGRQQGVVVVAVGAGLRAETAGSSGLSQIDAGELPPNLANRTWGFAFRYAAVPYELKLSVEKLKPQIHTDELVEAFLEPEQLTLHLQALYTIEKAGVFQLELEVPEGYELRGVSGQAIAGSEAASVDSHHLEGEKKTRLVVNLARKALGKVGLRVELAKKLSAPQLLSGSAGGEKVQIDVALPRVAPASIERTTGRLLIRAPESLQISPGVAQGLREISFAEAVQTIAACQESKFAALREVLGYAFTGEAATLALQVERRKPHITVRQLLVVRVEPGVVKYEASFHYDIRYSGIKQVRIDLPQSVNTVVQNRSPEFRFETLAPGLGDPPVAAGYVPRVLTADSELLGATTIKLEWEVKEKELEYNQPAEIAVPRLAPVGVNRGWGQVVLTKSESIDVHEAEKPAPTGLRFIDPQQDLMAGAAVPDAARAFEFQDDWSLTLTALRYKLEDVKRTSIEQALVRVVATRGGELNIEAIYRLRSARQRLLIALPADAGEVKYPELRLNGQKVSLESGAQPGEYFVPLTAQPVDTPLVMDLRYTIRGGPDLIRVPEFLDDAAMQKVTVAAYLPEEWVVLGHRGPWSDEQRWTWHQWQFHGEPHESEAELLAQITAGTAAAGDLVAGFGVEGRAHHFSTVRPAPGDAGALRVTAIERNLLAALVIFFLIALGVGLLATGVEWQFAGLALAVVLVILSGVFAPTFARQIVDLTLIGGLAIVLLGWFVWFLLVVRPRQLAEAAPALAMAGPAAVSPAVIPAVESPAAAPPPSPPPAEETPPPAEGSTPKEGG